MEENLVSTNSMTLRDYLRVIFRHKMVVIASIVTVIITVIIGLVFKTPVYESSVKMLISAEKQVESPYYREILMNANNAGLVLTQSEIVKSNPVVGMTVRALGLYQRPLNYEKNFCSIFKKPFVISSAALLNAKIKKLPEDQKKEMLYRIAMMDLRHNIKVEPLRDTNLFIISVQDFSPIGAAVIANALSRAYIIFDLQQQLAELQLKYGEKHPTAMQLKDSIEKMQKSLNGQPLPDTEAIGPASVKIVEQADVPMRPSGLPKMTILLLAVVMSIFLGVMLAFVCEYIDPTFKSREDIERFLNLPFLGSIYQESHSEYYRNLAHQIYLLMKDKKLKTILFSSALSQEGVTMAVKNLGLNLLDLVGNKVLIIDANLRDPALHKILKLSDGPGLTDVLEGKITLDKAIQKADSNLSVLTSGTTSLNPITLLDSTMMQDLIKHAKEKYEVVLIDCAELRNYRDAVDLSTHIDGFVLIISEGKTRRPVVKELISPLEMKKVNILGAVLTNRQFVIPEMIYKRI